MKKNWAIILCFALVFAVAAGCEGGGSGKPDPALDAVYEAVQFEESKGALSYMIGVYVGVPNIGDSSWGPTNGPIADRAEFNTQMQYLAECGISMNFPGYGNFTYGDAYNDMCMEEAAKNGITHLVSDSTLRGYLRDAAMEEDGSSQQEAAISQANARITARGYKKPGGGYKDGYAGLFIVDEPSRMGGNGGYTFELLGKMREIYEELMPGTMFYVNLFPCYGSNSQYWGSAGVLYNYESYIKDYLNIVGTDYCMFDYYALNSGDPNSLADTFIYNLGFVRTETIKKDAAANVILASIAFGGKNRAPESVADTAWQAYSSMAMGYDGIHWFTYWSPPTFDGATTFGEGIIGRDKQKTDIYGYVQTTNLEIRQFEHIFLNFDWKGAMGTIGSKNEQENNLNFRNGKDYFTTTSKITDIKAEQDTLTGIFRSKDDKYDAFMFVNFEEPSKGTVSKTEVTFKDVKEAAVIYKGGIERVVLKKGKLSYNIEAGQGLFVIPLG